MCSSVNSTTCVNVWSHCSQPQPGPGLTCGSTCSWGRPSELPLSSPAPLITRTVTLLESHRTWRFETGFFRAAQCLWEFEVHLTHVSIAHSVLSLNNMPHVAEIWLVDPLGCSRMIVPFPAWGYQSWYQHPCVGLCVFLFLKWTPRPEMLGHVLSVFDFVKAATLLSREDGARGKGPASCTLSTCCLILATVYSSLPFTLTWCLRAWDAISCVCSTSTFPLWRSVCSQQSPIFKWGCSYFGVEFWEFFICWMWVLLSNTWCAKIFFLVCSPIFWRVNVLNMDVV